MVFGGDFPNKRNEMEEKGKELHRIEKGGASISSLQGTKLRLPNIAQTTPILQSHHKEDTVLQMHKVHMEDNEFRFYSYYSATFL